jgi:hypothetical protein
MQPRIIPILMKDLKFKIKVNVLQITIVLPDDTASEIVAGLQIKDCY